MLLNQYVINRTLISAIGGVDAVPNNVSQRKYAVDFAGFDCQACGRFVVSGLPIYSQLHLAAGKYRQVVKLVRVLDGQVPHRNVGFLGVHAAAEVMRDHVTSRPLARMLMADAVPAMVEMNPPGANTCPTISGNV